MDLGSFIFGGLQVYALLERDDVRSNARYAFTGTLAFIPLKIRLGLEVMVA